MARPTPGRVCGLRVVDGNKDCTKITVSDPTGDVTFYGYHLAEQFFGHFGEDWHT